MQATDPLAPLRCQSSFAISRMTTMQPHRSNTNAVRPASRPWAIRRLQSLALTALVLGAVAVGFSTVRAQQQGAAILARGDAVVTGFSAIAPSAAPAPKGASPLDQFLIDPEGPSLQVMQLGAAGAAPQGQLIPAPAAFKAKAGDIGQVFAIAFDDAVTPNIYVAATSAYGLHIVGPDGKRLRQGKAGAAWMPGQFGAGGGPGGIYKVDGQTGTVSLFANISGNSGAGLGDIVYDKASRHFYVSDLDTGLVHRITADGAAVDSFDHGVTGRPAKALPAVADDGSKADIKSAAFSVEDPATWGYTANERLVWGLAIRGGRLYYAVAAGPQVWSVGLKADGGFAGDARWELDVAAPPGEQPSVISDMAFDGLGRLYLAQRGPQRGSYDYSVFAEPGQSAVLRYQRDATGAWVPAHEEYAVGLPPEHRSAAGGLALGYGHDATGELKSGTCDEMLWATGDGLRRAVPGVEAGCGVLGE